MHPCSRLFVYLLALTLLVPAAGLVHAQTGDCSDIPEGWQGVWQSTMTLSDCETGFVFNTQNFDDTICPGDCFDAGDESVDCTVVVEGSTATISCSGTEVASPGCTANFESELIYTLDGTSITGGGTQTVTYTGDCPSELVDQCIELDYSATRTNGSNACSVPVSLLNWSVLKGSFR